MISPPAKAWIWNLLSEASATYFDSVSDAPNGTSSDFGQLVVQRHLISGIDCAIAGLAIAAAAAPAPSAVRNLRRFIASSLDIFVCAFEDEPPVRPCRATGGKNGARRAQAQAVKSRDDNRMDKFL